LLLLLLLLVLPVLACFLDRLPDLLFCVPVMAQVGWVLGFCLLGLLCFVGAVVAVPLAVGGAVD
jgi:hypothetical protein